MSFGKKIAHKVEAATGRAKKVLGRVTGNTRLRAEGRMGQIKGDAKQAGDNITDAFGH